MSEAPDEEQYDPPTCYHCDAVGHGIVVGWEEVPGKGMQPILSSPCSYLEPYYYEPEEEMF